MNTNAVPHAGLKRSLGLSLSLLLVAVGLIAFGAYSLLLARYGRIVV